MDYASKVEKIFKSTIILFGRGVNQIVAHRPLIYN